MIRTVVIGTYFRLGRFISLDMRRQCIVCRRTFLDRPRRGRWLKFCSDDCRKTHAKNYGPIFRENNPQKYYARQAEYTLRAKIKRRENPFNFKKALTRKVYNARPAVIEKARQIQRRRTWIEGRLVQLARDDGIYDALWKTASGNFRVKRKRVIARLVAMARDDGIYDVLKKEYDNGKRSLRQTNARSLYGEEYRREL